MKGHFFKHKKAADVAQGRALVEDGEEAKDSESRDKHARTVEFELLTAYSTHKDGLRCFHTELRHVDTPLSREASDELALATTKWKRGTWRPHRIASAPAITVRALSHAHASHQQALPNVRLTRQRRDLVPQAPTVLPFSECAALGRFAVLDNNVVQAVGVVEKLMVRLEAVRACAGARQPQPYH